MPLRRFLTCAIFAASGTALFACWPILGGDLSTESDSGSDALAPPEASTRPPPYDAASGADASPDANPRTDGNTYYVSPTGNDADPGSSSAPWLTIQHAGLVVAAGDEVVVRAGTYEGAVFGYDSDPCVIDDCVIAGTATSPIVFEADPSAAPGSVVIAAMNKHGRTGFDLEPGCDYVNVVGFTVTNGGTSTTSANGITRAGIFVAQSTGNQILGNTLNVGLAANGIEIVDSTNVAVSGNAVFNTLGTSSNGAGISVTGSSVGIQILRNLLHDNGFAGVHLDGDVSEGLPGVITNMVIAGNVIFDNAQSGIVADGLESSRIENNVIYGNGIDGLVLYEGDAYGGSTGNVIVNNTIDQSVLTGVFALDIQACVYDNGPDPPTPANCATALNDTSTGNIAFNNVLLGGGGGRATSMVSSADLSASANITAKTAGLFADGGAYQLAPSGPGIGSGIAGFGGASATQDPDGRYDVGAFSFAR